MNKSIQNYTPFLISPIGRSISKILGLWIILSLSSLSLHAGGSVKPLCKKSLKKIEAKYGEDIKALFSGKGSDKNVLALKRLIAEEIDPDLAITAIKKYNEARKLRTGSVKKREAMSLIEELFVGSSLSAKKGRDIIIGSGGAVSARKTKTTQKTYTDNKKPRCKSKKTVTERAPKIKYHDSDQLAEQVILNELDGKTLKSLVAVI
ncbi:MAG: hypothetical protein AAF696_14440 [Bacteroidota bacterium]